ncbi:Uncharacterised protein [Vibrio cholerae]|nr:Uncharacterised protein [Vibrio cholerae]
MGLAATTKQLACGAKSQCGTLRSSERCHTKSQSTLGQCGSQFYAA